MKPLDLISTKRRKWNYLAISLELTFKKIRRHTKNRKGYSWGVGEILVKISIPHHCVLLDVCEFGRDVRGAWRKEEEPFLFGVCE